MSVLPYSRGTVLPLDAPTPPPYYGRGGAAYGLDGELTKGRTTLAEVTGNDAGLGYRK